MTASGHVTLLGICLHLSIDGIVLLDSSLKKQFTEFKRNIKISIYNLLTVIQVCHPLKYDC